jgi:protein arginine N-methyltransferase 1
LSSLILAEHRGYLADSARIGAFRTALNTVVRPGDTVLDLGSGTGVLAVLACRAGAERVYAVDATAMSAVARAVAAANGVGDRVTVIERHSQRVELPERVDVVVADQLGAFGVEAGLLEAFDDARRRHLKPGGVLVPRRLDLLAAPVSAPQLWADVEFWDQPVDGIDVSAVGPMARNVRYFTTTAAADLLGGGKVVASLGAGSPHAGPITGTAELAVERDGELHGVAAWFAAELCDGVTITNSPTAAQRLDRSNVFLPVSAPIVVRPTDRIRLDMSITPPETATWQITVRGAAGEERGTSRHSTVMGMPMSRDQLARTRPDYVATLTPHGRARLTVLSLLDGTHRLADIEAAVWEEHRSAFATSGEAAAFVARLIAQETV